jgi:hypothetical protein
MLVETHPLTFCKSPPGYRVDNEISEPDRLHTRVCTSLALATTQAPNPDARIKYTVPSTGYGNKGWTRDQKLARKFDRRTDGSNVRIGGWPHGGSFGTQTYIENHTSSHARGDTQTLSSWEYFLR